MDASMYGRSARSFGPGLLFHGNSRPVVNRAAMRFIAEAPEACREASVQVPGTEFVVQISGGALLADLDACSSAAERNAFFDWVRKSCASRHMVHGSHIVAILSAELADARKVATLVSQKLVVTVLATTKPDKGALRGLGLTRVRVACAWPPNLPDRVRAQIAGMTICKDTVSRVRKALHTMRCWGLNTDEIVHAFLQVEPSHSGACTSAIASLLTRGDGGERVPEAIWLTLLTQSCGA